MNGYDWWMRRLKRAGQLFHCLRLDHFRGLESYWAIPFGKEDGRDGVWEKGPGMDFIKKAKETVPELTLIAEDLGILTAEAEAFIQESGLPRMRVLQFAFDGNPENFHLPEYHPKNSVVYTGTHDNPTLVGWISGLTEAEKKGAAEALGADALTIDAVLAAGRNSAGDVFVAPVQDYLGIGEGGRMNTPGETSGNWTWRMSGKDWAAFRNLEMDFRRGAAAN